MVGLYQSYKVVKVLASQGTSWKNMEQPHNFLSSTRGVGMNKLKLILMLASWISLLMMLWQSIIPENRKGFDAQKVCQFSGLL
jgi:hypothetical protein